MENRNYLGKRPYLYLGITQRWSDGAVISVPLFRPEGEVPTQKDFEPLASQAPGVKPERSMTISKPIPLPQEIEAAVLGYGRAIDLLQQISDLKLELPDHIAEELADNFSPSTGLPGPGN